MKILIGLFFINFLFQTNLAWSSAECQKSTHTKDALGKWQLNLMNTKFKEPLLLALGYDGYFFKGEIESSKETNNGIKVQACEGDCCNGFSIKSGLINFWASNSKNIFKKNGRITIVFTAIDWATGIAFGEIRDQSWNKISDFKSKKL